MPGVFSRAALREAAEPCFPIGLRIVRGSLIVGALIALATFTVLPETRAQTAKDPVPPPKEKPSTKPADLYGDQGGEKSAAADSRAPTLVMRARREDTFLKLSNPRVDTKRGLLQVDYQMVSRGKIDGATTLVFRADDGTRQEVVLKSITGKLNGTIELTGAQRFGNIKVPTKANWPDDLEMYIIRTDDRFDPPLKVMVSNSTVMGKMKLTSGPRDWTAEEITQYTKPLAYKNPNAYPTIGVDVPAMPNAPQQHRYVDPDGNLLGLDFLVYPWEKSKAVVGLTAVYAADQPKRLQARSIARTGYAVAGAEVNVDKYVMGIRLLFCRVKADGTLDMKDAYAGDWIGAPAEGKATTLVNDGRRILGFNCQTGAIIERFSLVAEKAK